MKKKRSHHCLFHAIPFRVEQQTITQIIEILNKKIKRLHVFHSQNIFTFFEFSRDNLMTIAVRFLLVVCH